MLNSAALPDFGGVTSTTTTPPPQHHRHHLPTTATIPTMGALGSSTQKGCVWFSKAPTGLRAFGLTEKP
ncbi:hypothetical protein Tco_1533379 [Tanacetum coccineum]